MHPLGLVQRVYFVLVIPAVVSTILLYNYAFFLGCAFPKQPAPQGASGPSRATPAPFRLLALGDPQLEGSTSLPDPNAPLLPSLRAYLDYGSDYSGGFRTEQPSLLATARGLINKDVPRLLWTYRKRLDLFGNDHYLAHIHRTLHRHLRPTHVVVLGDLLGSQWIDDGEFGARARRFWGRVFAGSRRVEDRWTTLHGPEPLREGDGWSRRVINVAGNHDIGYSGDVTRERVDRFEAAFGKVNWDIRFALQSNASGRRNPELRLVVLNGMNLDGPAFDRHLQTDTYAFLNDHVIGHARPADDRTAATVLLTHIPLDKDDGVCVDGEVFEYGPSGLRAQNLLSRGSTLPLLEGVFGLNADSEAAARRGVARSGVILTGHDHEGCDVYHYLKGRTPAGGEREGRSEFGTARWADTGGFVGGKERTAGVREITVRSMMGSYGGNAGLLSAWFDEARGEWAFEYATCAAGVQHWWWAVHALDAVALACFVVARVLRPLFGWSAGPHEDPQDLFPVRLIAGYKGGDAAAAAAAAAAGPENERPSRDTPLVRTVYRAATGTVDAAASSGRQAGEAAAPAARARRRG